MLDFQFYQRIHMLVTPGSIAQLGELIEHMGSKKPMIVTDESLVKFGVVDKALAGLKERKIEYIVYDKVLPNAPTVYIDEASEICKKEKCDAVVGLGGGSVMDSAKAVNVLRHNTSVKSILEFVEHPEKMVISPGCVLIPTTSGTGSEVSDGMIVMGPDHAKYTILAYNCAADYSILDPEVLTKLPAQLTASTGLDALTHAIESYSSNLSNDLTDTISEKNIEMIAKYLPIAVKDPGNIKARSKMCVAASMAGWMLAYPHTVAGHSVGQTLGGLFDVPHGHSVAYADPWVIEFNAPAIPEKTKYIGEALGAKFNGNETPEQIGVLARDAFINFRDNVLNLKRVTEFPYDESRFEEAAEIIEADVFQNFQPRKMTKADALQIVKNIYGK